jgi:magnesium chelatase subunit H
VLAGNAAHYDGVIASLEARGLRVIPAFASGLDARPAVEQLLQCRQRSPDDRCAGLAHRLLARRRPGLQRRPSRAEEMLARRSTCPYIGAHPVEFQTLEQWQGDRTAA